MNTEQRRLIWRCRRGLLELDIVLQHFVLHHFNALSAQELAILNTLLALPDNTFWALLSDTSKRHGDATMQALLQKMRPL